MIDMTFVRKFSPMPSIKPALRPRDLLYGPRAARFPLTVVFHFFLAFLTLIYSYVISDRSWSMTTFICFEGARGPFQGRDSSKAACLRLLTESESCTAPH